MICESCKKEEATVLLTKIAADQKQALQLCPSCASQVAQSNESAKSSSSDVKTAQQDGGATETKKENKPAANSSNAVTGHLPKTGKASDKTCSRCGMTYRQFRKSGRFGCDDCYRAFSEELQRLMKRIHGAQAHVGKRPRAVVPAVELATSLEASTDVVPTAITDELNKLRAELDKAVKAEAYEAAAALRDRIGQLESAAQDSDPEDDR